MPVSKLLLLFIPFTLACSNIFGSERGTWEDNLAKWERSGFETYRYRFERRCFCGLSSEPMFILVSNESVWSVTNAATGEAIEEGHGDFYLTVDGLFDTIRDAIDRDAHKLSVVYHHVYGYPISVDIDYEENTIDEEVSFRAGQLEKFLLKFQ